MTEADILQLFGILYLVVGLGILINPKFYQRLFKDLLDNYSAIFIAGFISLAIGYILTTLYSCQGWSWETLVPVIGIIALVKGIFILALPAWHIKIASIFLKKKEYIIWCGSLVAVLGLALIYLSYFVV